MIFLAVIVLAQSHSKPAAPTAAEGASVRKFVRQFYHWYITQSAKVLESGRNVQPDIVAVHSRPSAFTPSLRKALLDDWRAQVAAPGRLVGLDYDPFFNAQDQPSACVVGPPAYKNKAWLVRVRCSYSWTSDTSVAIAEIQKKGNTWTFSNFRYEKQENLLDTLSELARERKHKPAPAVKSGR